MNTITFQNVRDITFEPPRFFDDPNGFVALRVNVNTEKGSVDLVFMTESRDIAPLAPLLTQDEALAQRIRELEAENQELRQRIAQEISDAG